MPTLKLKHSTISYIQKLNGTIHEPGLWPDWLVDIGCPVDGNDDQAIEIEVFPDRPDLLSHETLAMASRSFLKIGQNDVELEVKKGEIEIDVDPSLENVRPIIMGAVVRGVDTGSNPEEKDDFIQSLMDHQEKLHMTLGRKRKFSSIGVHDLSSLEPPFRVTTVKDSFSFTPLASSGDMTVSEILSIHPKGMEYSHLMDGLEGYPMILDSNEKVLSFPPIINGSHTTVDENTNDFFIDVTGWDERACEACLLLICLSMSQRGGVVESVEITGSDGFKNYTPRGDSRIHRVPERLIGRILGVDLGAVELSEAIEKMGGRLEESRTVTDGPNKYGRWSDCVVGEIEHLISMPRWRSDIMHPIDIVEDVAIGFGFNNLPSTLSNTHIDAIPLDSSHLKRRFGESMRACGLQEVQSLSLSNHKDQFDLTNWPEQGSVSLISNPITADHTVLRQYILPSLLRLLSANRHHELPQRVYELGVVVRSAKNEERGAWASAESGSGFTAAKGIVLAMLRDLGADNKDIHFEATRNGHGPWIRGRGSKIIVKGLEIGEFGEVSPEVSGSFGLKFPIHAGEIDLETVSRIIPDPVI